MRWLLAILLVWLVAISPVEGAVSCANPTNGISDQTAAQSSYTTGSITPVSGDLHLVSVMTRKATATNTPTLAGTNGLNVTWTEVATLNTGGSTLARISLFRGVASSGTAGTLTADYGGVNQAQAILIVLICSGVDQASNQGIVQSATDTGTSGATQSATLAAFGDAGNATAFTSVVRGSPATWLEEIGYTGFSSVGGLAGSGLSWLATNDTTPSNTSTLGSNWAAIGVEIKATGGAPPAVNFFPRRRF